MRHAHNIFPTPQFSYERRRPETTIFYKLIQENWLRFQNLMQHSGGLPEFVEKEFQAYLECGILAHGFLRSRCEGCHHERLVAFSCKKRGFCPSCGAKRMCETAALLVDHVIPDVPARQWVLSLPFQLRYLLAAEPKVMGELLRIIHRAISTYVTKRAGLKKSRSQTGAITLIQRFGGSINLNIHYHILALDGAYTFTDDKTTFHPCPVPTTDDLQKVLQNIITRVTHHLEKRGLIVKDQDVEYLKLDNHDTGYDRLQAASTIYRIAFGPRAGEKVFTLRSLPSANQKQQQGLQAASSGFSLHAGVACEKGERKKLEHLCRYISRPPVAEDRLRVNDRGQVLYKLKRAYDDGTTHIVLEPLEFMERLASLVPRPRVNLSRYHGIFAPHAKYRSRITPKPPEKIVSDDKCEAADSDKPKSKYRIAWAQLLKRVFGLDLETCAKCGKKTKIIAAILDAKVVEKILRHLHLPTEPPALAPARGPPIFQGHDPFGDEYSQLSPGV